MNNCIRSHAKDYGCRPIKKQSKKPLYEAVFIYTPILSYAFFQALEVIAAAFDSWVFCAEYNHFGEGPFEVVLSLWVLYCIYYIVRYKIFN